MVSSGATALGCPSRDARALSLAAQDGHLDRENSPASLIGVGPYLRLFSLWHRIPEAPQLGLI